MATPTDATTMEASGDVSDPTIGAISGHFKVTRGFSGIVENARSGRVGTLISQT